MSRSRKLRDAARTRTRTWPGPGRGSGRSVTVSASRPKVLRISNAFIHRPPLPSSPTWGGGNAVPRTAPLFHRPPTLRYIGMRRSWPPTRPTLLHSDVSPPAGGGIAAAHRAPHHEGQILRLPFSNQGRHARLSHPRGPGFRSR